MALRKPVEGSVSQPFGANPTYYKQFGQQGHNGIDYAAPTGTPIYAAEAGKIHFEGWGANNAWLGAVAGISVLIDHPTFYTGYAHLSSTIISRGQTVTKGQLIGYVGATGNVTGPHLHFEVLPKPVNISNGFYGRANPNPYFVEERKLVNESDLSTIYRLGPLGRTRASREGSDVYIGKTAEFVLTDHANSPEGKQRLASIAGKDKTIETLTIANNTLLGAQLAKDTEIAKLKAQLANAGGVDQATKDSINETNSIVKAIRDLLARIFK